MVKKSKISVDDVSCGRFDSFLWSVHSNIVIQFGSDDKVHCLLKEEFSSGMLKANENWEHDNQVTSGSIHL